MFATSPAGQRFCGADFTTRLRSCTGIRAARCPYKAAQWQRVRLVTTTSSSSPAAEPPPEKKRTIFSGIQPTGVPHLGNYLGALREWVQLQNSAAPDTTLLYSIVDLHALTLPQDSEVLRAWRRQSFATLLAVGLDPERSNIFFQSAVPAHTELMWLLSTVSSMGYLSRMTQWKSKLQLPEQSTLEDANARAKLKLGLFSYPVLQAADVLVHGTTHIPVGEDQKQHIEFAREVANGFNYIYGPVLTIPEAQISPAKRVMSLKEPHLKMSKSHADSRSRILLTDSPEEIHRKFKVALTDSEPLITYDPIRRPGVSNLIEILGYAEGRERAFEDIAVEHENTSLRVFKEHVAGMVAAHLQPIRERYLELVGGDNGNGKGNKYLDDVAMAGAEKARMNAERTMTNVREAVGLAN